MFSAKPVVSHALHLRIAESAIQGSASKIVNAAKSVEMEFALPCHATMATILMAMAVQMIAALSKDGAASVDLPLLRTVAPWTARQA